MGILKVKNGVTFEPIAGAGFRILGSLDRIVRDLDVDLTITCGSEGHSANDPHTLGRAFDVRSHGLTPALKAYVLRAVMLDLADLDDDAPLAKDGGLVTRAYFGWLEHPDATNEHLHFQLRRSQHV